MSLASLADRIDAVLPQTQCTKCGYEGCRPYAEALADGTAALNRCPPGGAEGIRKLATLLGTDELPLDAACGVHTGPAVALIDEAHCIGCTLCIQACPVDAIAGANKLMHTVLADQCTGCELCVPPCPVDCISMVPAENDWGEEQAGLARENHRRRKARLAAEHKESSRLAARTLSNKASLASAAHADAETRRQVVAEALARARARRSRAASRP